MEYIINFTPKQLRDKDRQKEYFEKCSKKVYILKCLIMIISTLFLIWISLIIHLKFAIFFILIGVFMDVNQIFLYRAISQLIGLLSLLVYEIESKYELIINEDDIVLSNTNDVYPVVCDKKEKKANKKANKKALFIRGIIETETYIYFILAGGAYYIYIEKATLNDEEYNFIKKQLLKKWEKKYVEYTNDISYCMKMYRIL